MDTRYRDLLGGIVPALALFATDLGYGWIAYAPIGPAYANEGIVAAFLAAAIGSIVPALVGGSGPLLGGARPAQTLIFASLLADVARQAGGAADHHHILITGVLCVTLAGLFQLAMGRVGLGRAIKYTPMPVLAGFTNGVALSMALTAGQMLLLAHDAGGGGDMAWADLATRAAFVGLLIALMVFVYRLDNRLHWSLVGLLVGTAGYHLVGLLDLPIWLGGTLPDTSGLRPGLPWLDGGAPWQVDRQWLADLSRILPAALTIALLNSLEALVIASQQDLHDGTRHDGNRVLTGQGLANMLGGLLGGLPSAPSNSRYRVARQMGATTRLAGVAFGLTMLALLWLIPSFSGWIPSVALAAILLYMAFAIVDDWAKIQFRNLFSGEQGRTIRRELSSNLAVMTTVMLVAVFVNLVAAMAVGVITSMFLFVRHHTRSIIARVYRGDHRHSSVMRPSAHARMLNEAGREIVLIELDGPLFFGSGDPLMDEVDRLTGSARHIILDFRQVDNLESSGAGALQRIARNLEQCGIRLYIAAIASGSPRAHLIQTAGVRDYMPAQCWYRDADHALEAAEDNLLQGHGLKVDSASTCRWDEMDSLAGLDADQIAVFRGYGRQLRHALGDPVFRRGDPGNALYLLVTGRVEILMRMHEADESHRLVALRPGTVFGEMAILKGGVRTADATVSSDAAELLALTADDLDRMLREQPAIAIAFFHNIGSLMASRITSISDDLRYALSGRH